MTERRPRITDVVIDFTGGRPVAQVTLAGAGGAETTGSPRVETCWLSESLSESSVAEHARSARRDLRSGERLPRAEHYRDARDASGVDPVAALRRYAAERRALGVLRELSLAAADRILAADPVDLGRLVLLSNPGTTELGTGETA